MSRIDVIDDVGDRQNRHVPHDDEFLIKVSEKGLGDRLITLNDPVPTGRQIIEGAGLGPASNYSIVIVVKRGTKVIGLDEEIHIDRTTVPRIHVFRGDRLYRATLNEREIVWGEGSIAATQLRAIGEVGDDQDLFLDSAQDDPIPDDGSVRLKEGGVERIRSAEPRDELTNIVLNGELIEVDKGRLSFSDLSKLAFPDLFGRDLICFTVSFTRGPKRRREGVLLEGDKVRIVEGMVFNVSATDKS